ncbi:MBL fold metallo-hydrolase [[Eubacterium] cellulosolvens]
MNVRFLGACREVGRSGVQVKLGEKSILLDYGVLVDHEIGFPVHISPKDLHGIVVTHAHLDHSGLVPMFYVRGRLPVYGVEPTFALSGILIRDMIKLSGYYLPYEFMDLETMMEHFVNVPYRRPFEVGNGTVTLLNAGHIPGSSQVLIEAQGRRIAYTSDFNVSATRLAGAADCDYGQLDALIIESTYAKEDHPDREESEKQLVAACNEIVEDGGTVLIPAFGVGRSQEVMCILNAHNFRHTVYVDGMALAAIKVLEDHESALVDPQLFKSAVKKAEWVKNWHDRRKAVKNPGVIVSPAGMLKGGAAVFHMESIARGRKNGIILVSYQVEGSPGRVLLDEGRYMLHGKLQKVNAKVLKFDFSSHGGRSELLRCLESVDKKAKVFAVHGEEDSCALLADWANKQAGLKSFVPKAGESYDV